MSNDELTEHRLTKLEEGFAAIGKKVDETHKQVGEMRRMVRQAKLVGGVLIGLGASDNATAIDFIKSLLGG